MDKIIRKMFEFIIVIPLQIMQYIFFSMAILLFEENKWGSSQYFIICILIFYISRRVIIKCNSNT